MDYKQYQTLCDRISQPNYVPNIYEEEIILKLNDGIAYERILVTFNSKEEVKINIIPENSPLICNMSPEDRTTFPIKNGFPIYPDGMRIGYISSSKEIIWIAS